MHDVREANAVTWDGDTIWSIRFDAQDLIDLRDGFLPHGIQELAADLLKTQEQYTLRCPDEPENQSTGSAPPRRVVRRLHKTKGKRLPTVSDVSDQRGDAAAHVPVSTPAGTTHDAATLAKG
jgi:hypothetical protein